MPLYIVTANIVFVVLYVATGLFLLRSHLNPYARWILVTIIAIELVLFALHFIYKTPYRPETYQEWIFNLDAEGNLPNNVSSMLFLSIAITSLLIAAFQRPFSWQQFIYWVVLGVLYTYLAFDEYASFHSSTGDFDWKTVYSRLGYVIVLASIYFAWRNKGKVRLLFALLVVFLGMMASGGILLDNRNVDFNFIEEALELGGLTFFLVTLITLAGERIRPAMWRPTQIILVGVNVGIAALMFFNMWIRPTVAYRLWGTDLDGVTFGDNMFVLAGYNSPDRVLHPGDTAQFTLYWYANFDPKNSYRLSAHMVSVPAIESVTQVDLPEMGVRTPKYWRPGLIQRRPMRLELPEDMERLTCLALTLRLWEGEVAQDEWRDATTGLTVNADSAHRVNEDTALLPGVVVIPENPAPFDGTPMNYTFTDAVRMTGYDIPDQVAIGEMHDLAFEWDVTGDVTEEWVQILHLFHEDGSVHILDRVPFDEHCPTNYWVEGMTAVDTFALALPEDITPGTYRLMSGFYRAVDGERVVVTDADGNVVENGVFELGEIAITAGD